MTNQPSTQSLSETLPWEELPMALQLIRRRRMEDTETAALLDRLTPLPRLLLLAAWQKRIYNSTWLLAHRRFVQVV